RELDDMPADARARVRRLLDDDAPVRAPSPSVGARSWFAWSLVGAAAGVALLLGLKALAPMIAAEREGASRQAAPDRVQHQETSGRASVHDRVDGRARSGVASPHDAVMSETPAPDPAVAPSPQVVR